MLKRFNAEGLSERRESCRVSCFFGGSVAAFDGVTRPLVGAGSSFNVSEATDEAGLLETAVEDEEASLGCDLAEPEPKRERAEGRDVVLRVGWRANIVVACVEAGVGGHGTRDEYAARVVRRTTFYRLAAWCSARNRPSGNECAWRTRLAQQHVRWREC